MADAKRTWVERMAALCDLRGERYYACAGSLFRVFDGVVRPVGPVVQDHTLTPAKASQVLRALQGRLIWWTDGCDEHKTSDWYAVICRRFTPLEELPAKHRSEMRRGLRNCTVRRVDAQFVSARGYEVYAMAYRGYATSARPLWDERQFAAYFQASQDFDDITHYWGAFHNDKLIALAANNVYDKTEVTYWMIKLDPDCLPLYAGYALVYTMNQHYLAERGFAYVNDGWRSLVHETAVQTFLMRKFGFVKAFAKLSVRYGRWGGVLIKAAYPLRRYLGRFDRRLAAVFTLEAIARGAGAPSAGAQATASAADSCGDD